MLRWSFLTAMALSFSAATPAAAIDWRQLKEISNSKVDEAKKKAKKQANAYIEKQKQAQTAKLKEKVSKYKK